MNREKTAWILAGIFLIGFIVAIFVMVNVLNNNITANTNSLTYLSNSQKYLSDSIAYLGEANKWKLYAIQLDARNKVLEEFAKMLPRGREN